MYRSGVRNVVSEITGGPLGALSEIGWMREGLHRFDKFGYSGLSIADRRALLKAAFTGLHVPAETADRVARWLENYTAEPDHFVNSPAVQKVMTVFDDDHDELVIVKDINFKALCEHHLLPFWGHASIAYIPQGKILGLSKFARVVEYYTRWPTLQEHITSHVADTLFEALTPMGVMVIINGVHGCMSLRGVEDPDANTTTSAIRGVFRDDPAARAEVLSLLK